MEPLVTNTQYIQWVWEVMVNSTQVLKGLIKFLLCNVEWKVFEIAGCYPAHLGHLYKASSQWI